MFPRTGAKPDINQKHRAMWRLSACCRTKPLFKQVLCFFEEHVPVFLRNINVYRVNLTIGVTETIRGRSENLKGKDVRELYYGKKIWIFEDNGTFLCLSFLVYKDYVEGQNARNTADRHKERNRTTDDPGKSTKTCSEETIYRIGNFAIIYKL